MQAEDFERRWEVRSLPRLREILETRYVGDQNAFWFHHDERPELLGLLVREGLAYLTYIPEEGRAGFIVAGGGFGLPPDGLTAFSISRCPADDVLVPNDAVIDFSTAIAAASEFFETRALPTVVDWFEL